MLQEENRRLQAGKQEAQESLKRFKMEHSVGAARLESPVGDVEMMGDLDESVQNGVLITEVHQ